MKGQENFVADDKVLFNERERTISQKMTVLHRHGGCWLPLEVQKIGEYIGGSGRADKVVEYRRTHHPGYLVVLGHITKDEIRIALHGLASADFNVVPVTGTEDRSLPFDPGFQFP